VNDAAPSRRFSGSFVIKTRDFRPNCADHEKSSRAWLVARIGEASPMRG